MKAENNAGTPTPSSVLYKLNLFFILFACFFLNCFKDIAGARILAGATFQQEIIVVPRYLGMQTNQAVSRMPNDRLQPGNVNELYADAPAGVVIEQFSEPGMRVDPGTMVNLVVSLGPPPERRVEVPNVTGLNIRQAEAVLLESGLQPGQITERPADDREEGTVLEQSPQAGTVVIENSLVNLVVSIRGLQVIVPDVIFMQSEKAIKVLKENRLNYNLIYERSNRPQNTVVAQHPPPGSQVNEGTVVFLSLPREKQDSLWLFFGGIILAAFAGGIAGFRLKKAKSRKKHLSEQRLEIDFELVWETGNQIVNIRGSQLTKLPLRFKYIHDSGSSTILKPEK